MRYLLVIMAMLCAWTGVQAEPSNTVAEDWDDDIEIVQGCHIRIVEDVEPVFGIACDTGAYAVMRLSEMGWQVTVDDRLGLFAVMIFLNSKSAWIVEHRPTAEN